VTRVGVVVQRCHASAVGGSEALAWQYARMLAQRHEVEVLTSTATEHVRWDDALPAGVEVREGIAIRRFPVVIGRTPYWDALYHRLPAAGAVGATAWTEALQDEFIRFQGPWCPALVDWLRAQAGAYDAVVFCTYLYATTYFGLRAVPAAKAILVPTLHDEPAAHLPVFRRLYAGGADCIWLTDAERRIAERIWGRGDGEVLGMAVEQTAPAEPEVRERPYFLYCGRIEAGKGCDDLLQAFERMPGRERASLVFTGADHLGLPDAPGIEYLGFVDEDRKRALMAGAAAFVMPSRYESFSIVTLEAMAQRTPVLVNGACEVLRDHVRASGGGMCYDAPQEMPAMMASLLGASRDERARMGAAGRAYVIDRYREEIVRERLLRRIDAVAARARNGS
jgi:glycosyltransferase involved in cell wall biosynthesis